MVRVRRTKMRYIHLPDTSISAALWGQGRRNLRGLAPIFLTTGGLLSWSVTWCAGRTGMSGLKIVCLKHDTLSRGVRVSTVFLGIDYNFNFYRSGRLLLWE